MRLLIFIFLVSKLLGLIESREVTIALAMCDKGETSEERFRSFKPKGILEFSRQYSQTLTLIKSLLISWKHGKGNTQPPDPDSLHLILFSNKETSFERLKSEVFSWDTVYTGPLRLTHHPVHYPNGNLK
jgi:hypothetical protein